MPQRVGVNSQDFIGEITDIFLQYIMKKKEAFNILNFLYKKCCVLSLFSLYNCTRIELIKLLFIAKVSLRDVLLTHL